MSGKQLKTLDIGPNMLIVLVLLLSTLGVLDTTTLCRLLGLVRGILASVTISLRSCDNMTTQRAVFNYEEVIDLHTEVGRVSVIGIHTPTGDTPRRLCPGFFEQFKKYKYVGCSISLVPAATLPADPAQVSIGAGGDPEIDARDMLNPVMFHGCHGNDLGNILNRIYTVGQVGGSDLTEFLGSDSLDLMNMANGIGGTEALDLLESLYYRALTDNTWKKAHIQRGFRKSGLRPRIYSLATNMQIQNASSLGGFNAPGPFQGDGDALNLEFEDVTDPTVNPIRYFTPRTVPLGWLDTRQVVPYTPEGNIGDVSLADLDETIKGLVQGKTIWNELPKVFMGVIMLPPAYKTEFYFRMIINHVFAFAGFRGISFSNEMLDMPPTYHDWNDMLSSGDSDEPVDPTPDPEPSIEYPAVIISNGVKNAHYWPTSSAADGFITFAVDDCAFSENEDTGKLQMTVKASKAYGASGVAKNDILSFVYEDDWIYVYKNAGSSYIYRTNEATGLVGFLNNVLVDGSFGYSLDDVTTVALFNTPNVVVS